MFQFNTTGRKKKFQLIPRKTASCLSMIMWIFLAFFCFLFVSWKLGLVSVALAVYYGYDWRKQQKKELTSFPKQSYKKKADMPAYDENAYENDTEQAEYF